MAEALALLPEDLVVDAEAAFDRYKFAMDHDALVQGGWHQQGEDGRNLACALGILGGEVSSASQCPASVMPRWLARMTVWLFDAQDFEAAKAWGRRFYGELARLKGQVPFAVVYDWHANVVSPFVIESLTRRGKPEEAVVAVKAVQALHLKHLQGGAAPRDEWHEALRQAYKHAYAYAYAYADADADAYAYADADADADAYAYADAYADAYAYADADADADAYAYADADADADATAAQKEARRNERRQANVKRLADGLIDCLARATAP